MVLCSLFGEESCSRRSHKGLSRIGEDVALLVDYSDANFVGTALNSQRVLLLILLLHIFYNLSMKKIALVDKIEQIKAAGQF